MWTMELVYIHFTVTLKMSTAFCFHLLWAEDGTLQAAVWIPLSGSGTLKKGEY